MNKRHAGGLGAMLAMAAVVGGMAVLGRRVGLGGQLSPKPAGPDLVVWAGPVDESQVPGATIPGAILRFLPPCTGSGSPSCGDIAESWTNGDGRKLPAMLAQLGLSESSVGDIFLGAFSAGGSTWKRLLMHPADRARIRAVVLADAMYSSPVLEPVEGFVRFGLDALGGDKLLVATSSASPNKTYGSGSEVLAATKAEIERRSGKSFELDPGSIPFTPSTPQPDALYRLGGVVFADYGWQGGGHMLHPKIAPDVWRSIVQPFAARRP